MQRGADLRNIAVALTHAFKLCRYYLGIIENKGVARLQQIRQLEHLSIFEWLAGADAQQPGVVTRLYWTQSNALFRQIEIEKINTHDEPRMDISRESAKQHRVWKRTS